MSIPSPPPPPSPDTPTARYDALIVGGGPSGATAALVLARSGLSVLVVERTPHPRFHVGESFLPRSTRLFRELGLADRIAALPHVAKFGVEFALGHRPDEESRLFTFRDCLVADDVETINVERGPFDALLVEAAREAGATVWEGETVREVLRLDDGGVAVAVGPRRIEAGVLLDASGQQTLLGKHLGTRRVLPDLKKVAYVGHFTGVRRQPGERDGDPTIVMMADGWFWIIPLDAEKTSVGLVMGHDAARAAGVPTERMLAWGVARCPFVRERMASARFPSANGVVADFSYRCAPYAGPGYFLVGDAATFVDPIFSTGVCLGMMGGVRAAEAVLAMRAGADPARERAAYGRWIDDVTRPFFRLVRGYYRPAFRDLLMEGQGPLAVHRAMLSILGGFVFPRPVFAVRWRLALFDALVALQQRTGRVALRKPLPRLADLEPGPLPVADELAELVVAAASG